MAGAAEVTQLKSHLALLREEYSSLQSRLADAERRADVAEAAAGISGDCFAGRLLSMSADVFEKDLFSDVTIHLDGHQLRGHRFILSARGDNWTPPGTDLCSVERLDFDGLSYAVGHTLLKWVYTDRLDPKLGDSFIFDIMRGAKRFNLDALRRRCEEMLIGRLERNSCVKFYQLADGIGAEELKSKCMQMMNSYWAVFTKEDFAEMAAPLLYKMLRSRTEFPLHAAIRLEREDVCFLYLIEYTAELNNRLNLLDEEGCLPLALALFSGQESLARTLLSHKADVNAVDKKGRTCLLRAVQSGYPTIATFLLKWDANVNVTLSDSHATILHLVASNEHAIPPQTDLSCGDNVTLMDVARSAVHQKKADVNLRDTDGNTPLHLSILNGNFQLGDILLDTTGINLNITNAEGFPPLWYSLRDDAWFPLAGKFMAKDASPSTVVSEGQDMLMLCLLEEEPMEKAALFLIDHGADVRRVNGSGETSLHIACRRGLAHVVSALLRSGANANVRSAASNDQTPLHMAIAGNHDEVVDRILEFKGAFQSTQDKNLIEPDLTVADATGETALGFALWSGNMRVASRMIKNGADVHAKDSEGESLLHRALKALDADSALFLIEHEANITARNPANESALELAVRAQLPGVVRVMCNRGADLTQKTAEGQSLLWAALDQERDDVASILVEFGCDMNSWETGPSGCRQTLLHRAIDENNDVAACFLIRSRCELDALRKLGPNGEGEEEVADRRTTEPARDVYQLGPGRGRQMPSVFSRCELDALRKLGPNGEGEEEVAERQSPLVMSASWGQEEVVKCLVEHGANVNAQDYEGKTAMHHAVLGMHDPIVKLLLRAEGLNLGLRDKKGMSAFAAAMAVKNNKAAQAIIAKDPQSAYQTDSKGYNFLHKAIAKSDLESVLFLLSIHMNVNVSVDDSSRWSTLHLAVQTGHEMIVRNLILAGANVNALTPRKQTALHVAAEHDHAAICSILLNHGINFDVVDDSLSNGLHTACQKGSLNTARVLLKESQINAEALNQKGQNPLHVLAQSAKDNSAAIFDLFLDTMPNYPLDKQDADGNTVLLLAYISGAAQLCKSVVRAGACIGLCNVHGVSIFNYQVATKQLLYKLLDQLSTEPKWADADICSNCDTKFTITIRKHHCRHCGRVLCSKCTENSMPILKYEIQKPVRVCEVCFDVLTMGTL